MFDKVNRKYENLHSFSNFSVFSELYWNCQFSCDSIVTKMFEKIDSGSDSFSNIRKQVENNMHEIMPTFV